ncbi:PTS transporter subunit EIIC [Romboutsia sp.]|uniref:PTS transporter subunit EIIC n=1 Tax=Romboutsia sp. TaxID=1965302 RepID=UPI003F3B9061
MNRGVIIKYQSSINLKGFYYKIHNKSWIKSIGKFQQFALSILPSIFNINEPIIYGIPIILNPIYLIPFMIVPPILGIITYVFTSTGIVPIEVSDVNWIVPTFLNGYITINCRKAPFFRCGDERQGLKLS